MLHKIFPVGPLQCNCSVIGDEHTREAMVIDPGDEVDDILGILGEEKFKLKYIVITHAHIDHVGGAMKLKAATGAPILMNQNDQDLLKMLDTQASWVGMRSPGTVEVDEAIGDGSVLQIGGISSNILHTPGHTEGSICIFFPEHKRLIAGDTLFAGSIGRTDLPGGSFERIIRSIHHQLLALPDDTQVVPGHGQLTTIGQERETNPFLAKNAK
ncbi:MAG TPA: MBL fold metallo-hydrolase [Candidatus Angelobacter sp.]|nr:MBL fold metallo-hydrolase [Candidatus Angelobacter sp.]